MSEPVSQADTSEPDAQETAGGEDAGTVEPVNSIAPVEAVDPLEADSGWTEVNETVYAVNTVNVRSGAGADTDKIGSLAKGESVTRTGVGTDANAGWSRVEFSGSVSYISSDYLSTEKPVAGENTANAVNGDTQISSPSSGDTSGQNSEKTVEDLLKQQAEMNPGAIGATGQQELTEEGRQALADYLNGDTPASSPSSGEEQKDYTTESIERVPTQEELDAYYKELEEAGAVIGDSGGVWFPN